MLTSNQQQIIDQLTSEFTQLNKSESESSGGVIDISEIMGQRAADIKEREEIRLSNHKYLEIAKQTMVDFLVKLRPDLEKLGLDCKLWGDDAIVILRADQMHYNHTPDLAIRILFIMKSEAVSFESRIESIIRKTTIEKFQIGSYVYETLEALVSDSIFKNRLKRLYNSTFPNF